MPRLYSTFAFYYYFYFTAIARGRIVTPND